MTKAVRIAARLREAHPNTRVLLVLTTNRVPDAGLLQVVHSAAVAGGIDLEIFDRSSIAHILDYTADGTALRRDFLGMATDRLSAALLNQIASESREAYAAEHPGLAPDEWAEREEDLLLEQTLALLEEEPITVVGLVGTSGFGKSAVALRSLNSHAALGGATIWVRGEHVDESPSFRALLDAALRDSQPGLELDAATHALRIVGNKVALDQEETRPSAFRIVVDDLMRLPDPVLSLRRLLALANGVHGGSSASSQNAGAVAAPSPSTTSADAQPWPPIQVLVPTWPEVWRSQFGQRVQPVWVAEVSVGVLPVVATQRTLCEALARRGVVLSNQQAAHAAEALQGDPLLTALVVEAGHSGADAVIAAVDTAMERFLDSSLNELVLRRGQYTAGEYRNSLLAAGRAMLRARVLDPTWLDVKSWLQDDELHMIREIARQGRICRIVNTGGRESLRFRHDRLRDALLTQACVDEVEANTTDDLTEDPYLARYVGGAIRRNALAAVRIPTLCEESPNALAEALRGAGDRPFLQRESVVTTLLAWLRATFADPALQKRRASQLDAVFASIAWSYLPERLALLNPWPPWHGVILARFMAGSLEDGLRYFESSSWGIAARDDARDRAVNAALSHDRLRVIELLQAVLDDAETSESRCVAALEFAGYTSAPELAGAVGRIWDRHAPTPALVTAALWAAVRIADGGVQSRQSLQTALNAWRRLPDDDGTPPVGMTSRIDALNDLPHAFARGLSTQSISALVDALTSEASRPDGLQGLIAALVRPIDDPLAQESVVRYSAPVRARERASGGTTLWLLTLASDWNTGFGAHRRKLSESTRYRMRVLWRDDDESMDVREVAFMLWAANARRTELPFLAAIEGDVMQPGLAKQAFVKRLALGDRTAVPIALRLAEADPVWYWRLAPAWDERVREAVLSVAAMLPMMDDSTSIVSLSTNQTGFVLDDALGSDAATDSDRTGRERDNSVSNTSIADMLRRLIKAAPAYDASEVLTTIWPRFGRDVKWVRVALAVATPQSVSLAHDSIRTGVDAASAFLYVNMDWRLSARDEDVPSLTQLSAVEPYLDCLDEMFLENLADGCRRRGFDEWAQRHLLPHLSEQWRTHHYPTDEHLDREILIAAEADLNGLSSHNVLRWLSRLEDDVVLRQRIADTALRFLSARGDIEALRVAASVISRVGTRRDLCALLHDPVVGDSATVEAVQADTRFAVRHRTGNGQT
ncbi:hypothetical protein [Gemmatimonas sp.]|uniref:hypothetical protein n=1 Tax=Gemmatimonas sp. TaxID=1962908 RepID=UPI003DA6528C